jgi:hypothetical protein
MPSKEMRPHLYKKHFFSSILIFISFSIISLNSSEIFVNSKEDSNDIQDSSKNPDVIPPIDGYVSFANGDIAMAHDSRYQIQSVNSISSNHVSIQSPGINVHSLNDFVRYRIINYDKIQIKSKIIS